MKYLKENKKYILLILALIALQSLVYFCSKFFEPYQIVLNNKIDDKIPFIPQFVHFYYIWYILLLLVPLLLLKYNKQAFNNYILTFITFITFVFMCYVAFPTTLIRHTFEVNSLSTFIVDLVYKTDTPVYNLFPSAHCAYAFLFITTMLDTKEINKKIKITIILISIGVILSTLFIKQHVIIDVIGALSIIPIYYFVKKQKINLEGNKLYAKIFR